MKQNKTSIPYLLPFAAVLLAALLFSACDDTLLLEDNPAFNSMWFILCDSSAPQSSAMTKNGDNWTTVQSLYANDYIKFCGNDEQPTVWATAATPDNTRRWFCPSENGAPASGTVDYVYGKDNAFAWRIMTSGTYTINLNPRAKTITFGGGGGTGGPLPDILSENLWLVKTKEAQHLSAADFFPMTGAGGVYTWEGALAGIYKFCAVDTPATYSDGVWFVPDSPGAAPKGVPEDAFFGNESDYAWYIPRGHYTITMTPDEETVTFTQSGSPAAADFDELWVIGVASMKYEGMVQHDMWNSPKNTARRMTKEGDGTYTWAFNFSGTDSHFRIVCVDNGVIFYPRPQDLGAGRGDVLMTLGTEYNMFTHDQVTAATSAAYPDDFSWWVNTAGVKTITVNPVTQKVTLTSGGTPVDPNTGENIGGDGGGGDGGGGDGGGEIDTSTPSAAFQFYGTAAGGWSTGTPLYEQGGDVYAWRGTLTTGSGGGGQIQFRENGTNIGPSAYTTVPSGGGSFSVAKTINNVFFIQATGVYTIRLNLNTNQVSFTP